MFFQIMNNVGRLRLVPLALCAGAVTAPLRVRRFVCRRGGGLEVRGNSEEGIGNRQ